MARYVKEEPTTSSDHTINLILAVEELNGLSSQELSKLLKESENFIIHITKEGSLVQIDMERLAWSLPLHLIAMLVSSSSDEIPLSYFLRGIRLLHSLSDLATRHMRFEQILLEEVKVSEQLLDLVFYMLIVLARYGQEHHFRTSLPLLHSTLVACSLHLLSGFISSQWQDLVQVLLAHPKVHIFMDVAFDAVHVDIKIFSMKLSDLDTNVLSNISSFSAAERTAKNICQQCEASLQFVLSLCQQKLFRDHLLSNKELCKNGRILSLARTILNLTIPPSFNGSSAIVAAVSRLKSAVLSILLQLCEAEHVSYLDEVAGSPKSMDLAKSVVLEILDLLKAAFSREAKQLCHSLGKSNPKGLVLLNSMRLADIFSDDSNFRSFFMTNITKVLAEILAMPHEEFFSSWCSTDIPMIEEDAILDYDPFVSSGIALASCTGDLGITLAAPVVLNEANSVCPGSLSSIPPVSYAQQRTSYLVKIIANLHCFVPNICEEEEKDLFLNKFHECLCMEPSQLSSRFPLVQSISTIRKNLCSLSVYASSLISNLLNEEDVQLLSDFYKQLLALTPPSRENSVHGLSRKDDGEILERNADNLHLMYQDSNDWAKFSNSNFGDNHHNKAETSFQDVRDNHSPVGLAGNDDHQFTEDAQSTGGGAPSLSRPDSSAQKQALIIDSDAHLKGFSENSTLQEMDQSNGKNNATRLSDEPTKLDQYKRSDKISASRNVSGSLYDIDKVFVDAETSAIDVSYTKGNIDLILETRQFTNQHDHTKESDFVGTVQEDKGESAQGEEKQPRKRKRNIMNDRQINLIEKALLEEPDMQRNAASLQSWADKLSGQGPELTPSQLKNWLNNRKARLARAAREARGLADGDIAVPDKSCGSTASHYCDSPESSGEEFYIPSTTRGGNHQSTSKSGWPLTKTESDEVTDPTDVDFAAFVHFKPGQLVLLMNSKGKEVGKGKVYQVKGRWHGNSLEDEGTCVVAVTELKVERGTAVPHPSEAAGMTFDESEAKNDGVMRVAWNVSLIFRLPQ